MVPSACKRGLAAVAGDATACRRTRTRSCTPRCGWRMIASVGGTGSMPSDATAAIQVTLVAVASCLRADGHAVDRLGGSST